MFCDEECRAGAIKIYKRAYKHARKNQVCVYSELLLESLID